jgi:hypothetical protein
MSLQACVERLFTLNSNYLHAEQAFNQASSLQTLSDDLYTDPFRFVYELVQNADDALSENLRIALIEDNYLIVAHDGKIFDEKDVRSLCSINNSTKTRDNRTAGYKGLGFKAIFGKSDYVLIVTNGESFRFDAKFEFEWTWTDVDRIAWERNNERTFIYPWQICPIWTESQQIPESIRTWLSNSKNKMRVNIIIRLRNQMVTRDALKELAMQPHTFLFLQNIRQVDFLGIPENPSILIQQGSDGSVKLLYNGNQLSQWLVSRRTLQVSPQVLTDIRLPEKLRNVSSTEIGLAAKLDESNVNAFIPVSNRDNVLFAYMPTKISTYDLPLLVNANFLTNANREQIHTDSIWNQWLFECIPRETIEWVKELIKKPKWGKTAYDLLPIPSRSTDILAKTYNESCSTALDNTKFICNTHGEYLSRNDVIIDLTGLSEQSVIGIEPLRRFIIDDSNPRPQPLPRYPFIHDNRRLRELNVRVFNWSDAIDILQSQNSFSVDQDINLISYLFDRRTDADVSKLFHHVPFILDRNQHLQRPTNIYFPSQFNDVTWRRTDCQEAYVHDDLLSRLQKHHRQWLEQLGVTVKTDLSYFHRTIIPNASTFIIPSNALDTVQRLFHLLRNGQIVADDMKNLGELCLITNSNTLVPANRLYLSSKYKPHLPVDTILLSMPELFVTPSYMQNDSCEEWKYFFRLLGVQETIDLITLNDNSIVFQNYHEDQMKIIFGLNSQQVHRYKNRISIRFLEFTEDNYPFARIFWEHALKNIDIRCLNQSEIAYWGSANKRGATEGSEVNTFPEWFIRTRPCIPVLISLAKGHYKQTCLKRTDVFTNKLSPLIGHYLPIFGCTPENDEWLNFFKFKTELSIDDHFDILRQIYIQNCKELDDEDDKRIQKIYANLLKILSGADDDKRQLYREKCQSKGICLQ